LGLHAYFVGNAEYYQSGLILLQASNDNRAGVKRGQLLEKLTLAKAELPTRAPEPSQLGNILRGTNQGQGWAPDAVLVSD
jgi:hypothetical protein